MRRPARSTASLTALLLTACAGAGLAEPHPASAQQHRAPTEVAIDSTFHSMDARSIGPGGTSGRIAAIAVSPRDDRVIYVGTATGGVWKSEDAGLTWAPIADSLPVNSIGAIGIAPSAPHVVYVGTGEANSRNSMGVGRGLWRSRDAGRTWTHAGLERTEHMEAILVHPADPNTVWVTALGPAWSDGEERGVFKSTDGGGTWRKVLYVDERTGAFELVMDPSNPEHLLASTWTHRRWPWFFESGGEGSGLWQTWDGGESWDRLGPENGLPPGDLGRIGLAFSESDPNVAYALVEAENSALLRSDDGGTTWRTVNDDRNVNDRAFYYSRVYVDPTNENRVYRVSGDLSMSEDAGRTFDVIAPWSSVHVDHHAFWAHPDGRTIITGSDGGVYVSHDRGGSWRFIENIPVAQFYHLSVDDAVPFNVLGGLQDNGSWRGPSRVWEMPGFAGPNIMAHHWTELGFGDGFGAVADPSDPDLGYSMSQGGNLQRWNLSTSTGQGIRPPAPDADTELRFNWNAGIALDPFVTTGLYYGSQFLHWSPDRGETWEILSPDLTTNDPEKQRQRESGGLTLDVTAAENHTTILTIAPSPLDRGVIWVGTDDGNVQVTRDRGETWTNVADRIPGVPANTWVPHIEASAHDAATAYVVLDGHRTGDWTTYVYRTTDYGRSWRALSPGQIDGYLHTIEEDPEEPRLLFVGSEFGLYFSLDGGGSWRKWTHGGYPAGAPTRALVVHPRDHDLAIGTHGRGAWIIDDIRPLREMARDGGITDRPLHLFQIPDAHQVEVGITGPYYFPGDTRFQGENRPFGALISYHVSEDAAAAAGDGRAAAEDGEPDEEREETEEEEEEEEAEEDGRPGRESGGENPVTIEILQADTVVRTLEGPAAAGVNRLVWGLERKGIRDPDADEDDPEPGGPPVLPGTYDVRIALADHVARGSVEVLPDPRRERAVDVLAENIARQREGQEMVVQLRAAVLRLEDSAETLALYEERLEEWEGADEETREALVERTGDLEDRLNELLDRLRMPETKGIVDDTTVTAALRRAVGAATGTPYAPTSARQAQMAWAMADAEDVLAEIERFYQEEVPEYREALREAGFDPLTGS